MLLIALCYPGCQNGGVCVSPNKCKCKSGFTGHLCGNGEKNYLQKCMTNIINVKVLLERTKNYTFKFF